MHKEKKENMKKFLISDVDGTLLSGTNPIPKEVVDAAKDFMNRGNLLSFCTGRSLEGAKSVVEMLTPNAPCILFGGALLYDFSNDTILFKEYLDESITEVIENILKEDEEISISLSTVHHTYTLRNNEVFSTRALLADRNGIKIDTIPNEPLIKVLLTSSDPEKLHRVKRKFISEELFHAELASRKFFEIVSSKVSKGKTIETLLSIVENSNEMKILGAGDSITDLSMIDYVDTFYAPNSALSEMLEKAHVIIPSVKENGMLEVFNQ